MVAELAIRFDIVAQGAMSGLGYATLAAGLILVFRASRVINLAHGQIGAFAAVVFVELANNADVPYALALPLALIAGGIVAAVVERTLIRPLARRSPLAVLAATIGVIQVLLVGQFLMPDVIGRSTPVPIDVHWEVDGLVIRGEHVALLVVAPVALLAVTMFLRRSRYGLAIRSVAENREAARLAGIPADRVVAIAWAVGGALAAAAAILTNPLAGGAGGTATAALGPSLLLRALVVGLVGRLANLRTTVIAGIAVGVVEAILFASYPTSIGLTDAFLFAGVLILLLVRAGDDANADAPPSDIIDPVPLAEHLRRNPRVRAFRLGAQVAALGIMAALPVLFTQASEQFVLARVAIFALIGVSVVVLTGWTGQISLAQMSFVGIGAMGTAGLASRGVPFAPAICCATIAGAMLSLVVGAPALRLRGLYLTVATLGFAVASTSYVLLLDPFRSGVGETASVVPGRVGPFDFGSYREAYYGAAALAVVVIVAIRHLRTTGIGRVIVAASSNERSASAMAVSPARAKLLAFGLSCALATFAGGLLSGVMRTFRVDLFSPDESLRVLAMVIVGGVGSLAGAVLGSVYLIGLPRLFGDSATIQLATSGIGLLVVLRIAPGGMASLLEQARDRLARVLAGDSPVRSAETVADPAVPRLGRDPAASSGRQPADGHGEAALEVTDLSVVLGGRSILTRVGLHVNRGEIVGLIGANGAGKTTLMDAISGFIPSTGTVAILGQDATGLSPVERARVGLGRSFQHARLFPRLTVRECVQVALERLQPSEFVPSLLAMPPSARSERWSRREADDVLERFGLGPFADAPAASLSTGMRRIVELSCLVAQRPALILLDEPLAGIAQRESEAFVPLLLDVRAELQATMLVIEHDLPAMLAVSDRLYCLETGTVIASGTPTEVRNDPLVVASYLGSDRRAIERSGGPLVSPGRTADG
jgi:ABC-type branched-subunit amino acid transport system ATPase component/branched-subunit amino acid ABC-type transport system permease component